MSNSGFLDTFSMRRFLFPLSLIWIAGCSSGSSLPDFVGKLIPVSGKLMLDGEPLTGATLMFTPDPTALGGETAFGVTDAGGSVEAMTQVPGFPPHPGVVEGRYVVTAFKLRMADGSPVPDGMTDADAEADGAKHVVPPIYLDPSTSPLKVEIKPGGESLLLELKSHRR